MVRRVPLLIATVLLAFASSARAEQPVVSHPPSSATVDVIGDEPTPQLMIDDLIVDEGDQPNDPNVSDATITVTDPSLASGQLTRAFQYRWPEAACGGSKRRATRR